MAGETNTGSLQLEVNIKTINPVNGDVIESTSASGKITKADAGRTAVGTEDQISITIEPSNNNSKIIVEGSSTTKEISA